MDKIMMIKELYVVNPDKLKKYISETPGDYRRMEGTSGGFSLLNSSVSDLCNMMLIKELDEPIVLDEAIDDTLKYDFSITGKNDEELVKFLKNEMGLVFRDKKKYRNTFR